MTASPSTTRTPRRRLLDFALRLTVVAWLASVLYPVISYLRPLPRPGPTGPVGLTRAEVQKVEREGFAIVPVGSKRVLVFEDAAGEIHALDARCTHEGCTVRFVPGQALIWCACHNGRFDLTGRVLSGPPPRPLPRYVARRESDGAITIAVSSA